MVGEVPPRIPDRRRDDHILRQILETLEATRATVTSMAGRISVLEREIGRTRSLWEDLRVDEMSLDQKRSLLEVVDAWDRRQDDRNAAGERLQRAATAGTVLQACIALTLAVLTLYTVVHH